MTTSGAAAAIAPEPQDGPGPVATADDEVITWAEFRSWERQLSRTGACSRPGRRVVPQAKLAAPVIPAFLGAEAMRKRGDLDQVAFLA